MKSSLQAISVQGKKSISFLKGITTAEVRNQSLNVFCNDQGKVLALAVILVHSDSECWVCVDQSLVSMMIEHLQFYGRFSSVKMMVLEQQLSFNEHWEWVQGDSKVDWVEFQYEKGLVFLDKSTSGKYTPQMLAYDEHGFIDWGKGCYLGQEVITRISHLGRSKRHLYRVRSGCDFPTVLQATEGSLVVLDEAQASGLGSACVRITRS